MDSWWYILEFKLCLEFADSGLDNKIPVTYSDDNLMEIIDGSLKITDRDNDGYIDWNEYSFVESV